MQSVTRMLIGAAMLAMVHGQGVITSAKGDSGESTALAVDATNKADANFISDAEISANIVNECGRTLAGGNIDIGEMEENALAANAITQVTKASTVTMTIDQVNTNGTGPYTCDMDQQGNTLATGQTKLVVKESDSGTTTTLKVTMPKDMACIGSSAGNVCTVRCRNAQNFGGCVAVQQTDVTPLPGDNNPANIKIASSLAAVTSQVQKDQKDLAAAVAANQAAATVGDQGVTIANALLAAEPGVVAATNAEVAKQVAAVGTNANAATTGNTNTNTNTGNGKGKGNKNKNKNNRRSFSPRPHARQFQPGKRYVDGGAEFNEAADN